MDFSENYRCDQQDQVQSAYYQYQQVTIHPMVMFYACPVCGDKVTDNLVCLSDILKHDAHFVDAATRTAIKHLKNTTPISSLIIFSDGCAGQYKSKVPFHLLLKLEESSLAKILRCYFGSRHGKSQCDPLGGLVKNTARRAVKSRRAIICNANDLFKFCTQNLTVQARSSECCHSRRSFVLLKKDDINLSTSDYAQLKSLPGTRQLHCIRPIGNNMVATRNLACFCGPCIAGDYNGCLQKEYVQQWAVVKMPKMPMIQNQQMPSPPRPTEEDCSEEEMLPSSNMPPSSEVPSSPCVPGSLPVPPPVASSTAVNGNDRQHVFKDAYGRIAQCVMYRQLQEVVGGIALLLEEHQLPMTQRYLHDQPVSVDASAKNILPEDAPPRHLPVCVQADGNCFPRALSMLLFGNEDHYLEMRCRIIVEQVVSEEVYMTGDSWGLSPPQLELIASVSDNYAGSIKATYRQDVLSVTRPSSDMGVWQVMAAARALNRPIRLVYPNLGMPIIRDLCNRTFCCPAFEENPELSIMWSTVNEDYVSDQVENFVGNHFVPLFPLPEARADVEENGEPSQDSRETELPQVGDFYSVLWQNNAYLAQVEEVQEERKIAVVSFMCEKDGLFFWPLRMEYSEEPFCSLLCKVKRMVLDEQKSTQRRQFYKPEF